MSKIFLLHSTCRHLRYRRAVTCKVWLKGCCRGYHDTGSAVVCENMVRGIDHIKDPRLNKGLAFTLEERQALGIHGLLAGCFRTMDEQVVMSAQEMDHYNNPLHQYSYLMELQERNEKLFFRLVMSDVEKYMPIVYTPTVGLVCQKFGLLYRRPRGLFITIHDKGHILNILKNWPEADVRNIVFTDGERILGLGDLGAYGMGIPVGKLALFTALAGIRPNQCLPIMLDVGTNNKTFLEDPVYIGIKEPRVRGAEYDEFINEFMESCVKRYGPNLLLQFEDFGGQNATRLLRKYQCDYCTFNDDIQGTAAVAVAGLLAATRLTKKKFSENIFMFLGAGSAGVGIATLIVEAMISEGETEACARSRVFMFDANGLVTRASRGAAAKTSSCDAAGKEVDIAEPFAKDVAEEKNFENAVKTYKPTCLIGVSTQANLFTPTILKMVANNCAVPIIFALSNPTASAECTAQDAYDHTEGRCIFASGSPFPPVQFKGKTYHPGQGNNAYIFPGLALGILAAEAFRVPNCMFLTAAQILAKSVGEEDLSLGRVYPKLSEIWNVSLVIAEAIAEEAYELKVATKYPKPSPLLDYIKSLQYRPSYDPIGIDRYSWTSTRVKSK